MSSGNYDRSLNDLVKLASGTSPSLKVDTPKIRRVERSRISATVAMLQKAIVVEPTAAKRSLLHSYAKLERDVGPRAPDSLGLSADDLAIESLAPRVPEDWADWIEARERYVAQLLPIVAAVGIRDRTPRAARTLVRSLQNEQHALRLAAGLLGGGSRAGDRGTGARAREGADAGERARG
jgi:hypothetical protein